MDMHTSENTRSIVDVISWAIPEKLLISVQASFPKLMKRTIDFALFTAAAISVHSMGIPPKKAEDVHVVYCYALLAKYTLSYNSARGCTYKQRI